MSNVENIDKLIEWIKADQGKHFRMEGWSCYLDKPGVKVENYEYCNTAFCLAGWINQHQQREAGATDKTLKFDIDYLEYRDNGAAFLGIDEEQATLLFLMHGDNQRQDFDALPHEKRAEIAIDVLAILKNTGRVAWDDFVPRDDDEYLDY